MTDLQTVEAIQAYLDTHPTDWQARLELADLFEDADELHQARLQRWLARHEKAPYQLTDGPVSWWRWFTAFTCFHDRQAALGVRLYAELPAWERDWGFGTRHQAEQGLLAALQASGWHMITGGV